LRITTDPRELQEKSRTVVTLGNFDGVHLAHQRLLRATVDTARRLGAVATTLTFNPHPAAVLAPERAPALLTPLPVKTRLIESQGIDLLVVMPFTVELSRLGPEEFVRSILVEGLRTAAVIVGTGFRFGNRRTGDVTLLEQLARREGFKLEVLPQVEVRGEPVSSSRIRQLISEGRVHLAVDFWGDPSLPRVLWCTGWVSARDKQCRLSIWVRSIANCRRKACM